MTMGTARLKTKEDEPDTRCYIFVERNMQFALEHAHIYV